MLDEQDASRVTVALYYGMRVPMGVNRSTIDLLNHRIFQLHWKQLDMQVIDVAKTGAVTKADTVHDPRCTASLSGFVQQLFDALALEGQPSFVVSRS